MPDLTQHSTLKAGDVVDVFVFRTKTRGNLYKGTVMWNGETHLLPYSRDPALGGFAVNTSTLFEGVRFNGKPVYGYRRNTKTK